MAAVCSPEFAVTRHVSSNAGEQSSAALQGDGTAWMIGQQLLRSARVCHAHGYESLHARWCGNKLDRHRDQLSAHAYPQNRWNHLGVGRQQLRPCAQSALFDLAPVAETNWGRSY